MPERWIPTTEEELRTAVQDGRLQEDHRTDFKELLKEGKSANRELAKDIASFANDGGVLIFGVADEATDASDDRLRPLQVDGLRERIDQVARSALQPPLSVRVRVIPSSQSDDLGYLLVEIPASPEAPHQVEGRYFGRSDSTSRILSDAEVRAVMDLRTRSRGAIDQLLNWEIERDPMPVAERSHGHLYVVAQPRYANEDQLLVALEASGRRASTILDERVRHGPPFARLNSGWSPDLNAGTGPVIRRARGWAMHSHHVAQDRTVTATNAFYEYSLLDFEIDEDGTLHLVCGHATAPNPHNSDESVIILSVIAGLTARVLLTAAELAALMGYSGPWDCGVAVDGLRGGVESSLMRDPIGVPRSALYSESYYRQTASTQTWTLEEGVAPVVHQLLGRLARGLNVADRGWIPQEVG